MGIDVFGIPFTWKQFSVLAATSIVPIPLGYFAYSGLCRDVKNIECRRPLYGEMRIAYKLTRGKYCARGGGQDFKDARAIQPGLKTIGIYYDDPHKVKSEELCRYIVGVILSEGGEEVDLEVVKRFEQEGYSFITLPEVATALQTSFPVRTNLSYAIASCKVYGKFDTFIKENNLRWNPAVEIYDGETIHYMVPQSCGEKFCVPDVYYDPSKDKMN